MRIGTTDRTSTIAGCRVPILCGLLFALLIAPATLWAADLPDSQELSSWSVAQRFKQIGHELNNEQQLTPNQVEQGVILLGSAMYLDSRAQGIAPEMIRLIARHSQQDHSDLMRQLLDSYIGPEADLEVIRQAIAYLQGTLETREQREQFLHQVLARYAGRNKTLDSDLATELALLKAEKSDMESAQSFFLQAYYNNKYNRLAFARLVELLKDQMQPIVYLEHTRLAFGQNPLDIESAVTFAQYAESLQLYDTAAAAYEYCVELFMYMQPGDPVPESLYLPWAVSCYNTERSSHKCLQIAAAVRQSGRFNLFLESIAAKAAMKIGDTAQANSIVRDAERRALAAVTNPDGLTDPGMQRTRYEQVAWFYGIVLADANTAVEWANKAYASDPNASDAAAILAYSLALKGQTDWSKLLIENYQPNQISQLAMALIQLTKGQKDTAIETLKAAIARDPGSLAAENARALLTENGADYIPPVDPELVLNAMGAQSQQGLVPVFVEPQKILSVELKLGGTDFSYGSAFEATIAIANNWTEPLVISDYGLFKGYVRIDAAVTGDIKANIQNLVSLRIRPASPIRPALDYSMPVQLITGELANILRAHPQASLRVEFTVYVDPVVTETGAVVNGVHGLAPTKIVADRRAVELSTRYLQNRLDSLAKGRQGQKIKSTQLLAGLWSEQQRYSLTQAPYRQMSADWMPELLRSALAQAVTDPDWEVRVNAMAELISTPPDYELVSAVSANLNHRNWPVRMMALYLLAQNQGPSYQKVLDWTAKQDNHEYVRQMAAALGANVPQEEPESAPATPDIPILDLQ